MTWQCTFQGKFVIRRLGLAMINLHTKLEVSMFTHYENMKGNAKRRNWGGMGLKVTKGHWQSHHSIQHVWWWDCRWRSHYSIQCLWLPIRLNRNYASVLYHFRVIASYLSKVAYFNLLHLNLVPHWRWPCLNFVQTLGTRKLESWAIMWWCLRDPTFSCFDIISVYDTHTHTHTHRDTETHDDSIYHASIALCGKNVAVKKLSTGMWLLSC